MRTFRLLAAVPLLLAAHAAPAADPARPASACLSLGDGWVRLPPASQPMLAGYGRIENRCAGVATVVAARSPDFAEVSLHETRTEGGVSRMREIERLAVAPGEAATLQPGGLHLMLMQPRRALGEGDSVPLVLQLEDGATVEATLAVRRTPPQSGDAPADHDHHGHHGH